MPRGWTWYTVVTYIIGAALVALLVWVLVTRIAGDGDGGPGARTPTQPANPITTAAPQLPSPPPGGEP